MSTKKTENAQALANRSKVLNEYLRKIQKQGNKAKLDAKVTQEFESILQGLYREKIVNDEWMLKNVNLMIEIAKQKLALKDPKTYQQAVSVAHSTVGFLRALKQFNKADLLLSTVVLEMERQQLNISQKKPIGSAEEDFDIERDIRAKLIQKNNAEVLKKLIKMKIVKDYNELNKKEYLSKPKNELAKEVVTERRAEVGLRKEAGLTATQMFSQLGQKTSTKDIRKSQLALVEMLESELDKAFNPDDKKKAMERLYGCLNFLAGQLMKEFRLTGSPSRLELYILNKKDELEKQYIDHFNQHYLGVQKKMDFTKERIDSDDDMSGFRSWAKPEFNSALRENDLVQKALKNVNDWPNSSKARTKDFTDVWQKLEQRHHRARQRPEL